MTEGDNNEMLMDKMEASSRVYEDLEENVNTKSRDWGLDLVFSLSNPSEVFLLVCYESVCCFTQ